MLWHQGRHSDGTVDDAYISSKCGRYTICRIGRAPNQVYEAWRVGDKLRASRCLGRAVPAGYQHLKDLIEKHARRMLRVRPSYNHRRRC